MLSLVHLHQLQLRENIGKFIKPTDGLTNNQGCCLMLLVEGRQSVEEQEKKISAGGLELQF